jgi:hypothetical protein
MHTKKSRRWLMTFIAVFFVALQLGALIINTKTAHADCTVNLNGYWQVKETVIFPSSLLNGKKPPNTDTVTGDKSFTLNQVGKTIYSQTHVGLGSNAQVNYQSAVQNDGHNCASPAQQFNETSTLLGTNFTCVANSILQSQPTICGINGGTATTTNPGSVTNNSTTPSCETVGGGPLDWLLCAVFDTLSNVSNAIFNNLIIPLLRQPPIPIADTGNNKAIYEIWSNFRIYADIILVIFLIVVIFMQAVSGGTAEVYTAKKALPKLLAAAILINLSIYIVAFMVDMTNIIGAGMAQIITAPLANSGNLVLKPGLGSGALFTGGALIGGGALFAAMGAAGVVSTAAAAVPFLLVNAILPLVIGFIIAFLVLALRQALIILLVIVSPIAFALWFLPNTESAFKRWWSLFFETLAVYPIAVLIFSVFNVVAVILGGTGGILGPIGPIIAVVIEGISLVAFIFAFRFASQGVGKIHDIVSNRGNQLKEYVKGNVNDPNSLRNRVKRNFGEAATRSMGEVMHRGDRANATRRQNARGRFAGMFGNVDQRLAHYNRLANERRDELVATMGDGMIYGAGGYKLRSGQRLKDYQQVQYGYTDPKTGAHAVGMMSARDFLAGKNVPTGASLINAATGVDAATGKGYIATTGTTYMDSKGRPISSSLYSRSKRLYGNTQSALAASLEYPLRKAEYDEDIANFREAFAQNAIDGGWSQDAVDLAWANDTYGHKNEWASEWYSSPKIVTDPKTGQRSIKFEDVGESEKSYDKMTDELQKARPGHLQGTARIQDWQAMGKRAEEIQNKIDKGTATADDLTRFAKTHEIFEAATHEYGVAMTPGGTGGAPEITVQGGNPEVQAAIKAIFKGRRYAAGLLPASGGAPGFHATDRGIFKIDPVTGKQGAQVGVAKDVTSDRSAIPSEFT